MSEEKVLAVIGGEAFTEAEFSRYLESLPREQKAYASNPYFRQQILEQVINTRLMTKYAQEQKLEETAEFQEQLKAVKNDMLAQMAIGTVANSVQVTDEEAQEYFQNNKASFAKDETVSAKHILVADEAECQKIASQIKAGELTFEDAASQFSTCPSKAQGGDLGEFGHGQMVAEFDQAAFAAEVDDVVGPVKTQFGYHLIKVYKKSDSAVPTYEEVAANVKNTLLNNKRNDAIQAVLTEMKEKYLQ